MALFPDEFPFKREPAAAPAVQPEPEPALVGEPVAEPAAAEIEAAPLAGAPASPAPPPHRERRKSPRQRISAKAMCRIDGSRTAPLAVELSNLSMLGVQFRSAVPIPVAEKANLRVEVGPLKWASRLRVVFCLEDAATRQFVVGCQFVGNELWSHRSAAA